MITMMMMMMVTTGCVGPSSDAAGKAAGCAGCPNQKLCASGKAKQEDPALKVVASNLEDVSFLNM